jgi:hypothetical protein
MSINIPMGGNFYPYPQTNDQNWGIPATSLLVAISQYCLQSTGGTFALTADLNLGTNFGLVADYIRSQSILAADAGVIRLANSESINWRNIANSNNLSLNVNSSDQLNFNGTILGAGVGTLAISGVDGIVVANSPLTSSGTISLSLGAITPTSISSLGAGTFNGLITSSLSGTTGTFSSNLSAANILATSGSFSATVTAGSISVATQNAGTINTTTLNATNGYFTNNVLVVSNGNSIELQGSVASNTVGYVLNNTAGREWVLGAIGSAASSYANGFWIFDATQGAALAIDSTGQIYQPLTQPATNDRSNKRPTTAWVGSNLSSLSNYTPIPTNSSGLGQIVQIYNAVPAGGTWFYFTVNTDGGGNITGCSTGVVAGGSSVGSGVAPGFAWRIA